jgi:hypothetical protein
VSPGGTGHTSEDHNQLKDAVLQLSKNQEDLTKKWEELERKQKEFELNILKEKQ